MEEIVKLLLAHGADPNIYGGCRSRSALSAAAHIGNLNILKALLDAGADLREGALPQPLRIAGECRTGSMSAADGSIENLSSTYDVAHRQSSASVDDPATLAQDESDNENKIYPPMDDPERCAMEQNRRYTMFRRYSAGDDEAVYSLLDRKAMFDRRVARRFQTALIIASETGHDAIVQELLQRGASVNKTDISGGTALLHACLYKHASVAQILVENGADCNLAGEARASPLFAAIRNKDSDSVKLLLKNGVDPELAQDESGSPLRVAAVRGHEPIVRLLIEHGASVTEDFPLIKALRHGHTNIARLLVAKNADVNAVQHFDFRDGAPLWLWQMPSTESLGNLLLSLLPLKNLCLRPKWQRKQSFVWIDTPLWVAAVLGNEDGVKLLLDHGADPKAIGAWGLAPLEMALLEGHTGVIEILLAAIDGSNAQEDPNDFKSKGIDGPRRAKLCLQVTQETESCEAEVDCLSTIDCGEEDVSQRHPVHVYLVGRSKNGQDAARRQHQSVSSDTTIQKSDLDRPFVLIKDFSGQLRIIDLMEATLDRKSGRKGRNEMLKALFHMSEDKFCDSAIDFSELTECDIYALEPLTTSGRPKPPRSPCDFLRQGFR